MIGDHWTNLTESRAEMLITLSKRSGGIPDFAKDALRKMGIPEEEIEEADREGRK